MAEVRAKPDGAGPPAGAEGDEAGSLDRGPRERQHVSLVDATVYQRWRILFLQQGDKGIGILDDE